jgi:hypothetical protein
MLNKLGLILIKEEPYIYINKKQIVFIMFFVNNI